MTSDGSYTEAVRREGQNKGRTATETDTAVPSTRMAAPYEADRRTDGRTDRNADRQELNTEGLSSLYK
jgi:hypothetical protein